MKNGLWTALINYPYEEIKMKLKLISVSGKGLKELSSVHGKIQQAVSEILPDTESFSNYDNSKDFLLGLSKAFEQDEIILIAADIDVFLEQKQLLLRSLRLKGEFNNRIVRTVSQSMNEDESNAKIITSHSVVPKDSVVFQTKNGLYSGFGIKSGNQHLIFIPLDVGMFDEIFDDGFIDYIKFAVDPDSVQKEEPCVTVKPVDEQSPAYKAYVALSQANLKAAVAITQTASLVKKRFSEVIELTKNIDFVPCEDEQNPDTPLKTHVASLAKTAKNEAGADIGVAISKVYSTDDKGDKLFILVSVANEDYARLIKLSNDNGESPKELANGAVDMLFKMLCEYTENKGIPPEDANVLLSSGDVVQMDYSSVSKAKPKRAVIFIAVFALITIALCFIVAFFFDNIKAFAVEYLFPPAEITYSSDYSYLTIQGNETSGTDITRVSQISTTNQPTTQVAVAKPETAPPNIDEIIEPASDYTKVTTTKPTTTKPTTTKKITTKPTTTKKPITNGTTATTKAPITTTLPAVSKSGTFTFKTKGYGHGVGMSQQGALAYSAQGWTYDKILLHYYAGTSIKTDGAIPETVLFGNKAINIREYLARSARAEIGDLRESTKAARTEAIKAQIVTVYTYAKYYNFKVSSTQHAYYKDTYNALIDQAVEQVLGKYVSYNNKPAFTPYSASCAGQTTSAQATWGGSQYPYLKGGIESIEKIKTKTETITSDELRDYIEAYAKENNIKITLSENPAEWIQVISRDSGGYVEKICIGDVVISGYSFRFRVLQNKELISHCFTYEYKAN